MKDLTVDVGILMTGSGLSDDDRYADSCQSLMKQMRGRDEAYLVLDSGKLISSQYDRKMRHGTFGHEWVRQMAKADKISIVKLGQFNRGVRTALIGVSFSREDLRYVRAAAESCSKRLVSHDPHYSPKVRTILRRRVVGVVVQSTTEATCWLTAS
ncbi:MAG: hypothetical protein IH830_10375 [Planctomycetes bacterium]|nr:hypothetical protein [Planctomycetota bacterium]